MLLFHAHPTTYTTRKIINVFLRGFVFFCAGVYFFAPEPRTLNTDCRLQNTVSLCAV